MSAQSESNAKALFGIFTPDMLKINEKISIKWIVLFLAVGILYFIGSGNILINGHLETLGITRSVPWGLMISTYVFFVVSSTGLCLVSSMGHVFGIEKYETIGKRAIMMAILTIVCGFAVIGMELGHPLRMALYNVISPNFHSAIWWMGTLYGVYLVFIIIEFYFLMKHNHKGAFYAGLGGFLAGISAHSNLGAVFGLLESRPFWHGPFLPIYFILSAMASGSALVIIIYAISYGGIDKLPEKAKNAVSGIARLFALLLGILIFFEIWKIISSVYGAPPEKYEATMALMFGPLKISFWLFEILLGMLLPFLMLLYTKANNLKIALWASISAMVGIFFMRYNLVVAGQLVPMRADAPGAGVQGAIPGGLVSYSPSFSEWAVVIGAIGICVGLYLIAERYLNLEE